MINYQLIAQSYSFAEHMEKLSIYLAAVIPLALALAVFFAIGIWWAKKLWFGRYTEVQESRKATQEIMSGYATTVDEHARLLSSINGEYQDNLKTLSLRDKNISELTGNVKSVSKERDQLKNKYSELAVLSNDYKSQIASLNNTVGARDEEVESLKTLNLKAKNENERKVKDLTRDLLGKDGELDAKGSLIEELRATIAEREETINEMATQKLAIEKQVVERDATIKLKDSEIGELSNIQADLNKDLVEQKKQAAIKDKRIAELEGQLKSREAEIGGLNVDKENMRDQLVAFEKEYADLEQVLGNKDMQIATLQSDCGAKDDEIAAFTVTIEDGAKQLAEFETEFITLSASAAEKDNEIQRLTVEVEDKDQLAADLADRDKLAKNLQKDNDQLRADLAKRDQIATNLKADNDKIAAELADNVKLGKNLQKDNDQLRADLAKRDQIATNLKADNVKVAAELADNVKLGKNLQKNNDQLLADLAKRDQIASNLKADNDKIAAELADNLKLGKNLQKENDKLLADLAKRDQIATNLKADNDKLSAEVANKAQLGKKLQIDNDKLSAVLAKRDQLIAKLQQDLENGNSQRSGIEAEIIQLNKFLEVKDDEISQLLAQAEEKDALSQLVTEMEQSMQSKESELTDKLANKDNKLLALKKQAEESDSRLSSALADLKMTESELQKIEEEFSAAFTPLGSFRDESNVIEDDRLGVIFTKKPIIVDDLKLISGVASVLEKRLNEFGVYRFKQIAIWKQEQIDAFSEELSFKDRINTDLWIHQAADLHRNKYAENLAPQVDIYKTKVVKEKVKVEPKSSIELMFKGENVVESEKLGILFKEKPENVDDLKLIKGVAGVLEQKLNEHGVYQFKQIATWTPAQIEEFGEQLSFKDRIERDFWVHQAMDLHHEKYGEYLQPRSNVYNTISTVVRTTRAKAKEKVTTIASPFGNESVKEDKQFGYVFTKRPAEVDDLKLIKGVGSVLEKALNEFGVYRFKQIALWKENVVREFVENLPFGDRVTRDAWIDQASSLHQDKYQEAVAF